ncbi:hypothetical protein MC885_006604 [Smutsia gigantea]|nr:hypothetical protein MC885_006604 [Smutsia gigantea]
MHMHERRGGSIVPSKRAAAVRGGGRRAGQAERMERRALRAAAARGRAGPHGAARDVVPGLWPVRAATLT